MGTSAVVVQLSTPAAVVQIDGPNAAVVVATDTQLAVVSVAEQGPPGPPGVSGAVSGSPSFDYEQSQASTVWTVQHNLNKYPGVTVIDSAGSPVYGDVSYATLNTVVLTFSAAMSGTAHLV